MRRYTECEPEHGARLTTTNFELKGLWTWANDICMSKHPPPRHSILLPNSSPLSFSLSVTSATVTSAGSGPSSHSISLMSSQSAMDSAHRAASSVHNGALIAAGYVFAVLLDPGAHLAPAVRQHPPTSTVANCLPRLSLLP